MKVAELRYHTYRPRAATLASAQEWVVAEVSGVQRAQPPSTRPSTTGSGAGHCPMSKLYSPADADRVAAIAALAMVAGIVELGGVVTVHP